MWFRMLELLYSPFVLLLISYNNSENIFGSQRKKLLVNIESQVSNVSSHSHCPLFNERSVRLLFHDSLDLGKRGCYEENDRGPCGENMKLYSIDGTSNGECDCDASSSRIMLFHNQTNRCFPIFQQGFCKTGEQLITTRENPLEPVCRKTACHQDLLNPDKTGKDLVPYKNNTIRVEVGSKCDDQPFLAIGFEQYKVTPSCVSRRSNLRAIGVPSVRCSPGTYRAITGHCQPPVFSFDDWD